MPAPDEGNELITFLSGIPLFEGLDRAELTDLAATLEPVHIPAGQTLVAEGEAGDCLYLVVSGRLRVSVRGDGVDRPLHELSRGAVIGEIALVSQRPRSASILAVRDSDLLRLAASSFADLVDHRPAVLRQVARLLVDRLLVADRREEVAGAVKTLAVAPAGRTQRDWRAVGDAIVAALSRTGSAMLLDAAAVDAALTAGASQSTPPDPKAAELLGWLHAVERRHDHVVYVTDPGDTPWTRTCLRQADLVLFAGPANGDTRLGAVEAQMTALPDLTRQHLVLVHPVNASRPTRTDAWLAGRAVEAHHHLRLGYGPDERRVARLVTGRACGLVLGGGGPRGFAHLGVMRALEEAGIPIDAVGGTSIGALMGALTAQDLPDRERVDKALSAFVHSGRLVGLTLPFVSLSSARRINRLLTAEFGSLLIEDLWTSYFCVSANLTRAEEVVHQRGELWKAVRASLSLPGAFPPVYAGGDLLVDGAVLNNVPVDVMRAQLRGGSIIAVDLLPEVELRVDVPFDPGLSGWQVLSRRLNPLVAPLAVPGIAELLSRASALSSVRAQRLSLAAHDVDLLLRPPIPRLGALEFKAGPPLIDIGYRYAVSALEGSELCDRVW